MEFITFKDFKNGKGFFDSDLREEDIKLLTDDKIQDEDILVNFAYTDYGGDFFDKVAIEYFSNPQYSNYFHAHKTVYYGKNAILWGCMAKEFKQAYESYPLGFNDIEDFYYKKEREAQEAQADEFLKDYKDSEGNKLSEITRDNCINIICDELSQHSILSNGIIDICEDNLIEALENYLAGDEYKLLLSQEKEEKINKEYYSLIK